MGNDLEKDPFEGVEETQFETPPEPKPEEKPPAIKAGGASAFRPADSSGDDGGGFGQAFDEDSIFDFIGDTLNDKINDAPNGDPQQKPTYANTRRPTQAKEVFDPEQVEIVAVMYVEILEGVTQIVCEMISGFPGAYGFKKTLKEKYEVISARLMQHERIAVSPMHLFVLATILLVGGSAYKAFGDKKKKAVKQEFAKKSNAIHAQRTPGDQAQLFDSEPVIQGRTKFEAVIEDGTAYYKQLPNGGYCKKSEREEVPAEIVTELFNFHKRNSTWPTKKQVETFLTA